MRSQTTLHTLVISDTVTVGTILQL